MRFTMKAVRRPTIRAAFIAAAIATIASYEAKAESAFVEQARRSVAARQISPAITAPIQAPNYHMGRPASRIATPEATAAASGANFAGTLEIGNYNRVLQAQRGYGNVSTVGIIKGTDNNVGVLQAGNFLKSNLVLIKTTGLSIGVIQPNGSAPINMLIARLPNGGLLIKR